VLDRLKANGGVVMVIFLTGYLKCERAEWYAQLRGERARLESLYPGRPEAVKEGVKTWRELHAAPRVDLIDVVKHIDYIRDRIGAAHIGLGGDFDGMGAGPIGLEDVSKYPDLIAKLLERGYSESEVKGIIGENTLRVMRGVEKTAKRMRTLNADERPPLHWIKR
jgi:membrane dipeptidase